jgi:hypothetical protein
MYLRQAQLFARLVSAELETEYLPRLPWWRICAKVMDDSVEEIDNDVKEVKNGLGVMQVVLGEESDDVRGLWVEVKVSERFTWH